MKSLRSLIIPALLLLTLPLLAPMCSKKNNDVMPKNAHPADVAHIWTWKKLLIDPPADNVTDIIAFYEQLRIETSECIPVLMYDFKKDGTIVPYEQTNCLWTGASPIELGPQTGDTWAVNGKKIIITHLDGSKHEMDLELKDGTLASGAKGKIMIWKRPMAGRNYTWVYERKL